MKYNECLDIIKLGLQNKKEITIKEQTNNQQKELVDKLSGEVISYEKKEDVNGSYAYLVKIEALHVMTTNNNWLYSLESLESSLESWILPYKKPIILYHKDEDGIIIGRVIDSSIKKTNTRSGTPALLLTVLISDEKGIKDLEAGLLTTVSVGVASSETYCTICGQNVNVYGACEHEPGYTYEIYDEETGNTVFETCSLYAKKLRAKELSYVISPSDMYAHNVEIKKIKRPKEGFQKFLNSKTNKKLNVKESMSLEDIEEIVIKESEVNNMNAEKINKLLAKAKSQIDIKEGENKAEKLDVELKDDKEPKAKEEITVNNEEEVKEDKTEEVDWKEIAEEATKLLASTDTQIKQLTKQLTETRKELFEKNTELSNLYKDHLEISEAFIVRDVELKEALQYIANDKEIDIKESEEEISLKSLEIKIQESITSKDKNEEENTEEEDSASNKDNKEIEIKESEIDNPTLEKEKEKVQVKEIKITESTNEDNDFMSLEDLGNLFKQ